MNKRIRTFENFSQNYDLIHELSILNGLIQEKEVVLGDKLIEVLKAIKSPISDFLLKCASEKSDVNVDYSYINFDKQDTMISYLKNRWEGDGEEFKSPRREKLKIGRLIIALASKMGVKFDEREIESFVNKYKNLQQEVKFELVKGMDVQKWYLFDNYDMTGENSDDKTASLYASCMRHKHTQDYFTIYTTNPNVSMLCLIDNDTNKLRGRAIVWHNATINEKPGVFMDRIYTYKYSTEDLFKEYAKKNGWLYKDKQSSSCNDITDGTTILEEAKVEAEIPNNINWDEVKKPYMDTLDNLVEKIIDGTPRLFLTNKAILGQSYIEVWNSTGGETSQTNPNSNSRLKKFFRYSTKLNVNLNDIKMISENEFKIKRKLYITCSQCDGKGVDLFECDRCESSGKISCDECEGDSISRCDNYCDEGYIDCNDCDENGSCSNCDGSGKVSCEECSNGKLTVDVDCPECDGHGKINDGDDETDCENCSGSGSIEAEKDCEDCDGEGEVDCTACYDYPGSGKCENCSGRGTFDCGNNCDSGYFYCEYCSGGEMDCPECEGVGEETRDCEDCDAIGIKPKSKTREKKIKKDS